MIIFGYLAFKLEIFGRISVSLKSCHCRLTVFPLQATILSECSSYVGCKLSRFDSQLRLGIAKKTQVDDFAGRYFPRDFIAAPGLLDDQFQAVLGHRPVGVE